MPPLGRLGTNHFQKETYMQIRHWIIQAGVIAAVALIGDSVAPQSAEARTILGSAGVPPPAHRHCFWTHNGTMLNYRNGCPTVPLDIPLVIDSGGTKNITVTAKGAGGTGCRSEVTDFYGDNVWYVNGGNYTFLSMYNQATNIVLTSAHVPGWGSLLVSCLVPRSAEIYTVNWNP
jgi:hypothetical protein